GVEDATGATVSDRTYDYDDRNQLTLLEDLLDPAASVTYGYDAAGNQVSRTENGVVTDYAFDARDHLRSVTRGGSSLGQFLYDHAGLRVEKLGERGAERYTYDDGSVLVQSDGAGLTIAKYDYGPDRLLSLSHQTEGVAFYQFDALGSVVGLTGADGTVRTRAIYDAWGELRSSSGSSWNRFGFTGLEEDRETGLIYANARYYDPAIGRFLSQDPLLGSPGNAPSLHRYLYAFANPTRFVDPTGLAPEDAINLTPEDLQRFRETREAGKPVDLRPGDNLTRFANSIGAETGFRDVLSLKDGVKIGEQAILTKEGEEQLIAALPSGDFTTGALQVQAGVAVEDNIAAIREVLGDEFIRFEVPIRRALDEAEPGDIVDYSNIVNTIDAETEASARNVLTPYRDFLAETVGEQGCGGAKSECVTLIWVGMIEGTLRNAEITANPNARPAVRRKAIISTTIEGVATAVPLIAIARRAVLARRAADIADGADDVADTSRAVDAADSAEFAIKPGRIVGTGFNKAEREAAEFLAERGQIVERIPVSTQRGVKTPDFRVNGVLTELKTAKPGGSINQFLNQVQKGKKQARNIIIDARGAGITKREAARRLRRVYQSDFTKGKIDRIEVILPDGSSLFGGPT
nr:RHS repeat-associated core domain-containing protein [Myxococcota bacterium]